VIGYRDVTKHKQAKHQAGLIADRIEVTADWDLKLKPGAEIQAQIPAPELLLANRKRGAWLFMGNCLEILDAISERHVGGCFDVIFADPPYEMEDIIGIPDLIFNNKLLKKGGWFVLEHSRDQDFEPHPFFLQHRKYGKVNFSIFLMPAEESTDRVIQEDIEHSADAMD